MRAHLRNVEIRNETTEIHHPRYLAFADRGGKTRCHLLLGVFQSGAMLQGMQQVVRHTHTRQGTHQCFGI